MCFRGDKKITPARTENTNFNDELNPTQVLLFRTYTNDQSRISLAADFDMISFDHL